MADHDSNHTTHISTDDARGGASTGVTRYVLAASLVLVIVAFVAIYFIY